MSFLGDIRERRRETTKQAKTTKAKAKGEARYATRLSHKVYKVEVKAAKRDQKHQHKLELKEAAGHVRSEKKLGKKEFKLENRASKRTKKMRKASAKDEKETLATKQRHQTKMAEKILEQQRDQGFTKDKAKSWIGGTHLLMPVLVPLAYHVITAVQRREHPAATQKFGVSADGAARYQGHGAPLLARIEVTHGSLTELRKPGAKGTSGFTKNVNSCLDVMVDAISAAEKVTPKQCRRVHHSITVELDSLDCQIISELNA